MAFLNNRQLKKIGLASFGDNCLISDKASFYNPQLISMGHNVRIDDFCVLSAGSQGIELGNYIHLAVFCSLIGRAKIRLDDYAGLSSRVAVYSSSDDFSGQALTNPTVSSQFTQVYSAPVILEKHSLIGAGSVVLPGSHLHQGAVIGALSLVKGNYPEFTISGGIPAVFIKNRKKDLLKKELTHAVQEENDP